MISGGSETVLIRSPRKRNWSSVGSGVGIRSRSGQGRAAPHQLTIFVFVASSTSRNNLGRLLKLDSVSSLESTQRIRKKNRILVIVTILANSEFGIGAYEVESETPPWISWLKRVMGMMGLASRTRVD
jgi:hypothetical protein